MPVFDFLFDAVLPEVSSRRMYRQEKQNLSSTWRTQSHFAKQSGIIHYVMRVPKNERGDGKKKKKNARRNPIEHDHDLVSTEICAGVLYFLLDDSRILAKNALSHLLVTSSLRSRHLLQCVFPTVLKQFQSAAEFVLKNDKFDSDPVKDYFYLFLYLRSSWQTKVYYIETKFSFCVVFCEINCSTYINLFLYLFN